MMKIGLNEVKLRFRTRLTTHFYDKYLRYVCTRKLQYVGFVQVVYCLRYVHEIVVSGNSRGLVSLRDFNIISPSRGNCIVERVWTQVEIITLTVC